ncbi:RNA polymerase sigma factor RpoE [hydrothermal vent metagenome]|uniref:RNA polymerase sigma factor RpoE n=1 Tax=hydrothermal vent metagenome TaxID=652676 RepID=A0A3B1BUF7_9ZZZZ
MTGDMLQAPPVAALAIPKTSSRQMSETKIVNKAKQGDGHAFGRLFERYKHFVWSVAYRMTYDFDVAEDVAQDVFVSAWKSLNTFRGGSAFSTWLYKITVNKTLNRLRPPLSLSYDSGERGEGSEWDEAPMARVDKEVFDQLNPESRADAVEVEQTLAILLSQLDPDRRIAIILREIEGLSYQEIASATGAPIGTVRSRIARGRAELEKLADEMEETK